MLIDMVPREHAAFASTFPAFAAWLDELDAALVAAVGFDLEHSPRGAGGWWGFPDDRYAASLEISWRGGRSVTDMLDELVDMAVADGMI